jgi:hypothetical protein
MRWLNWALAFSLAIGLSGCFWFDENGTSQLAGQYQLVKTSDGNNFLYFDDPTWGTTEPLLSGISATGVIDKYLVIHQADHYYLFSLLPTTDDAVRKTRVGPLTEKTVRPKLYQLTGDSTLRLASEI